MRAWARAVSLAAVVAASGCGSSSPAQGGVGQHCYPNGTCNGSLSCFSNLCVDAEPDGGAGRGGAGGAAGGGGANGTGGTGGAAGQAGAGGKAGAVGGTAGAPDASTFDPASLPGLSLWLDATRGVTTPDGGTAVSVWKDQSPKGNDAIGGGVAPVLVPSSINNLPALEFAPSSSPLGIQSANGTADLGFGTNEFLVEVVAKSSAGAPLLFQTQTGPAAILLALGGDQGGHASVTETGGFGVQSSNVTFGNGVPYLVGARRTGSGDSTTLELRIDGFVDGMMTGSDYAQSLGDVVAAELGSSSAVDIAEVVVVKGTTSPADLADLEAYLKAKYGL